MRPTTRLDRAPRGVENRRQFVFAGAVLGGFPGDVDLDEQIDRSPRGLRRLVDLLHQRLAVDRMDDVEAAGFLRLVRLEMSDEVPAHGQV